MKPEQTLNDIQYALIEKLRVRVKELELENKQLKAK